MSNPSEDTPSTLELVERLRGSYAERARYYMPPDPPNISPLEALIETHKQVLGAIKEGIPEDLKSSVTFPFDLAFTALVRRVVAPDALDLQGVVEGAQAKAVLPFNTTHLSPRANQIVNILKWRAAAHLLREPISELELQATQEFYQTGAFNLADDSK